MDELVKLSVKLHVIFIYAMILIAFINLFFIMSNKEFLTFTKRVRFLAPQYYMFFSAVFFTGLLVFAVTRFSLSLSVLLMILVWVIIFITSIKTHKIYKKTHPKDEVATSAYKRFMIKKFIFDIVLLLGVTLLTYVLR
jgi:hypothetical protein